MNSHTLLSSMFLSLLCSPGLGCLDNPYGRAATIVDGSSFPPELRGVLLPRTGYAGGQSANIYLFGEVAPELATGQAIEFVYGQGADQGQALPSCRTGLEDGEGQLNDVDLDRCQGPILPALPDEPGYAPFVRVGTANVPGDYLLNRVRSPDEVTAAGLVIDAGERVATFAVIDPNASLIDPAGVIPRNYGWYLTLQAAYLDLGDGPQVVDNRPVAMELLVPVGQAADATGNIVTARSGEAGYSTLCSIIYFQTPPDYQPGDYTDAADVPANDRVPPDPEEFMLCAVP